MRWLKIAINLLLVFLGLLFKSELERIDKVDPIGMIGSIPIAGSSVLQGLIGACIVAFAILNWSAVRSVSGFFRRLKIRLSNEEYKERKQIINRMTELRDILDHDPALPFDSLNRPPENRPPYVSSSITILIRELRRLELAPPEDANPQQWIFHLNRLLPFVRSYEIEKAKKEMESWYSNDGD